MTHNISPHKYLVPYSGPLSSSHESRIQAGLRPSHLTYFFFASLLLPQEFILLILLWIRRRWIEYHFLSKLLPSAILLQYYYLISVLCILQLRIPIHMSSLVLEQGAGFTNMISQANRETLTRDPFPSLLLVATSVVSDDLGCFIRVIPREVMDVSNTHELDMRYEGWLLRIYLL